MNKKHLLIFGRTPVLSMAELIGFNDGRKLNIDIKENTDNFVVVEGINTIDAESLLRFLAGFIKVASVVKESARPKNEDEWVKVLEDLMLDKDSVSPLTFGLSFYGKKENVPASKNQERIALTLKKKLRVNGRAVRWVSGRGQPLTSVQVDKNNLVKTSGAEFIIVCGPESIIIGRTLAVQPFEEWGERDFGRPRRDAKAGMLPPKLARMMINMLGLDIQGSLLDPFCGSGTILTEAVLSGWPKVLGSDKDEGAVKNTLGNLGWIQSQVGKKFDYEAQTIAIESLDKFIAPESIHAIVTEPYLGPPLKSCPTLKEIKFIQAELLPIYANAFRAFSRALVPGGKVVMIIPRWLCSDGQIYTLPVFENKLPAGLSRLDIFRNFLKLANESVVYSRPQQFVLREIILLEKVA